MGGDGRLGRDAVGMDHKLKRSGVLQRSRIRVLVVGSSQSQSCECFVCIRSTALALLLPTRSATRYYYRRRAQLDMVARSESMFGCYDYDSYSYRLWSLASNVWNTCQCEYLNNNHQLLFNSSIVEANNQLIVVWRRLHVFQCC